MATMTTERENRTIQRTICVGLGGTGRDVLMRIRRQIIDRYGSLNELPVVTFVHVDTDTAASKTSGLRTGSTYHGEDILFRDAEKVSATMNKNQVNNFVQGVEKRSKYSDQINPYDHIASWFPPQLMKDLKAIEDGAKGIRPVGRLAFFNNFRQIQNTIKTAENKTRGHEGLLLKKGLKVESGLNIFVVGSLCGGTGSGMFLDVAYTLRNIVGNQGVKILGYFIIAPELYGDNPIMNANTYSALKELNYYATKGNKFTACYDPQLLVNIDEDRPPFDYTYLVSNETKGYYKILDQGKLCNIIARKISLDFAGDLSPTIKGMRDNFLTHLISFDEHPRPNNQLYLTFGLAEIYFPRDKIIQVAWKHISVKVVQFWLNGIGQNPDSTELLDSFLNNIWKTSANNKDYLSIKLQDSTQEGNNTFSQTLKNWVNKLTNDINSSETKDDRQGIINQLPNKLKQQFRTVQTGESESTRGIWLTLVQQNRSKIIDQFKADITEYLALLLSPNNRYFSLNNARNFLQALKTKLNDYAAYFEEKKQGFRKVYDLDDLERKWRDTEQILSDIENKGNILFNQNKQKNTQFQQEVSRVVKEISDLMKRNFEIKLTEESLEIVTSLLKYVQQLDTNLTKFNEFTKELISRYEREEDEQKQLNLDDMSGEAIFTKDDLDDCYKILIPEEERQSQLTLLSENIVKKLTESNSLLGLVFKDYFDNQQLQKEIDTVVEGLFGSRSLNLVQSVIKRFMQKYSTPSDRSHRLEQIIEEAELLLPLNLNDPYFYNDQGKNFKIIGFKDTETTEVGNFKQILTKDLGISNNVLKPIQGEDEIIFVQEYGGFPLRILTNLEIMRQQYLRLQNLGNCLHNEYQVIFTDIVPPDAIILQQLQDVLYPSIAFNLLQYNPQKNAFEFEYYDELRGEYRLAFLSYVWNAALEQLAMQKDMTQQLEKKLENIINNLPQNPHLWEQEYKPKLQEFVRKVSDLTEHDPNFSYKDIVTGKAATFDKPYQEGIIGRFMTKIEKTLITNYPAKQLTQTVNLEEKYLPKSNIIEPEIVDNTNNINPDSKMDKLRELVQMKKEGFLTEEEFNAAKKRILGI